ncbi:ABC transporter ATP-binding protein [Acidaminobacter sp. JC074]|uniref:ABC transporter ATP-binding protein n=1 Tax=Acidaminobacter sp. JC074 TaxID=2530199 RepID=UPI001F0FDD47|nr:ABC transporter ATP-binding protein [Acidaminobacter sp. JC074]MCH4890761.1 ABC transporter ATP-binding protein [Acidaminobacter sp. JC074]
MFRKFASYYKPHMRIFIIDLVCAMVVAAVDLIFPALSGMYVDDFIPNKNTHMMLVFAGVILAMYLVRVGCNFYINYWGHVMGSRIQYDMRKELFSHLQSLPFKFFDDNKTGKIMNHMTSDLAEVSELAHHGPEDIFLSTLMLVGSFILLFMKNAALAGILMFCVAVLLIFTLSRRKKVTEAFRDTRRKQAEINSQIENSISGIRLTQSFSNEEYESDKFDIANVQYRDSVKRAFKQMGIYSTGTHFLADLLGVVIIVIGGLFVAYERMSMGELVTFLLYTSIFIRPVRRLIDFTQQLQRGMTGFERVYGILNIDPDIKDSENAKPLKDVKGSIELENVTFSYESDHINVLKDFSLSIEEKKTLALVGPSGVGKTTISQIIPRFYDVNQGDIKIDGHSVKDVTLSSLRKNIGIVQQDVFLFYGTIRDNILYGNPEAGDDMIIEAAKAANIHDFIMSLPKGYEAMIGERGVKLSGGQKQRLAIARVFLKNPPILILDEATSSLDNATELAIQASIERLAKDRTTVIIAHRLSTIKNADEIIVLSDDGIVERGNHDVLIEENGVYSELYHAQFKGFIPDKISKEIV